MTCCVLGAVVAACALVYLLSYVSRHVNFLMRTVGYGLDFALLAVIHFVYCPFHPRDPDNTYHLSNIFYRFGSLMTGIKIDVEGEEHLESYEGGYILCANHQSSIDTLCMSRVWPHRAVVMMKRSLLYVPLFGWAAYISGHEFIQRSTSASNAVRAHMDNINDRITRLRLRVWVFPEGTRNIKDQKMLPFKKGGFHMAQQSQAPIVPVVFSNVKKLYDPKNWYWASGTLKVKVLPPVHTSHLQPDDVTKLSEDVRALMEAALEDVNKES